MASLSARRAWIEILDTLVTTHADLVALRKESVDRNLLLLCLGLGGGVALRKESVDRNSNNTRAIIRATSRSPQGERG